MGLRRYLRLRLLIMCRGRSLDLFSSISFGDDISAGGRNITVRFLPYHFHQACLNLTFFYSRRAFCGVRRRNRSRNHLGFLLVCTLPELPSNLTHLTRSLHLCVCSLQFPQNGRIGRNTIQAWWGNTVWQHTADFRSIPLKRPEPGSIFGYVAKCFLVILFMTDCGLIVRIDHRSGSIRLLRSFSLISF